jgi:MFS family permease
MYPFDWYYQKKMWKTRLKGFPVLFILANSISWFSLTMLVIGDLVGTRPLNEILLISGSYFGGLIGSAAIGATILYRKLRGKGVLLSWVLFGTVTCLLFSLEATTSLPSMAALSLVLGASAGLGIPTCFSFFGDQTKTENRGKIGAIMFFIVQLFSVLIIFLTSDKGVGYQFLILALWRLLGVAGIIFYKPLLKLSEERITSIKAVVKERTFILYFLPWFLFTLVNFTEAPITEQFFGAELFNSYFIVSTLISSISAFFGGVLCDIKGRKITGILGFVLLGMGYAFLSFFSAGPGKDIAQILYVVCDGIAWGLLYVTFIFIVWGDASEGKVREKYYFLGGLPFLFSGLIQMLVQPFAKSISITASFSLASFFLFLAIIPLLYAPETLSEKSMKDRELKNYLEKAQKFAQDKTEKNQHNKTKKSQKESDGEKEESQEEEESPEDIEAQKLAEKYY